MRKKKIDEVKIKFDNMRLLPQRLKLALRRNKSSSDEKKKKKKKKKKKNARRIIKLMN